MDIKRAFQRWKVLCGYDRPNYANKSIKRSIVIMDYFLVHEPFSFFQEEFFIVSESDKAYENYKCDIWCHVCML